MSKRTAPAVDAEVQPEKRLPKRQKLDAPRGPPPKAEEIHSSRQLQQLLIFQQDNTQQLRNGIHSLKVFLESILYPSDEYAVPRQRAILREFLDTQKSRTADPDAPFLSNVIQTWSFASQSNNEQLSCAVVAVLALLLKTLSSNLELREYGTQLCRTILQVSQLKLVGRGLSAPKHKDYVISPCLRLLTEVVSFDGGAVAKQVYSKRDFTFDAKILARNLGIRRTEEDAAKDKRRPAVRTNAVKYLLAHFRNQEEGAKIDILKHGMVVRALFDHIRDDPPEIAIEILEVVKSHVIADKEIPRANKTYMLSDRALSNIASLYRVEQPLEDDSDEKSVDVGIPRGRKKNRSEKTTEMAPPTLISAWIHLNDLITFFAIRILIIAFQKLEQVLSKFKHASAKFSHDLWDQAAERLVSEFRERCPKMKDVIAAFRKIPEANLMQQT
ncbi:putative ribosome biogenesis protein [Neofusicoccum parvum UCRNP2]|uniref:Putative ribosome biogenesis protein n=1 Tax=Botryosphaeria parva (strain UCR-NP2) TaxID=1287680 RepID=R1ER00_BOTPV|nr:putative ribosome biogenesis protein [Neofusicoccum parvum UCRNP2]